MNWNKTIKTIGINLAVLIALIVVIDLIIITSWKIVHLKNYFNKKVLKEKVEVEDQRAFLPNYQNEGWAFEYFKDLNKLNNNNYISYIGWRRKAFVSKYININKYGIRKTPQQVGLNDSVVKITFLGGSTMWGIGAPDDKTIPAIFAKLGDGKYQTENFGESGYRAMQSYIFLMLKFNKGHKTDWVITYDGVNEVAGLVDINTYSSTYSESKIRQLLFKEEKSSNLNILTYKDFFFDPVVKSIKKIKKKKQNNGYRREIITTDKRIDEVSRLLLDAWNEMFEICKRNNSKFLAVLQPNAALGSPNTSYLKYNDREKAHMKSFKKLYERIRTLLYEEDKYAELKNHFLDLTHAFDGDEKIFIDWCHMSPNGNLIVAERINNFINNKR